MRGSIGTFTHPPGGKYKKNTRRHAAWLVWSAATHLLDVVVETGLELVVEDALTLYAEVEAVQHVPETAHLFNRQTKNTTRIGRQRRNGGGGVNKCWLDFFTKQNKAASSILSFAFHFYTLKLRSMLS